MERDPIFREFNINIRIERVFKDPDNPGVECYRV